MTTRKFYRFLKEYEIELIDEQALREFDLHPTGDGAGNVTGLVDMPIEERIDFAISEVFTRAMREAEQVTGVRWIGSGGFARPLSDDEETYLPLTFPEMPARRNDGSLPGFDDE